MLLNIIISLLRKLGAFLSCDPENQPVFSVHFSVSKNCIKPTLSDENAK